MVVVAVGVAVGRLDRARIHPLHHVTSAVAERAQGWGQNDALSGRRDTVSPHILSRAWCLLRRWRHSPAIMRGEEEVRS